MKHLSCATRSFLVGRSAARSRSGPIITGGAAATTNYEMAGSLSKLAIWARVAIGVDREGGSGRRIRVGG